DQGVEALARSLNRCAGLRPIARKLFDGGFVLVKFHLIRCEGAVVYVNVKDGAEGHVNVPCSFRIAPTIRGYCKFPPSSAFPTPGAHRTRLSSPSSSARARRSARRN